MAFASLIVSRSATSAHIFIYYVKIQPLIMPKLRHSGKTLYDSLGLFGYQPEAGSHLKIAPQDRTSRSHPKIVVLHISGDMALAPPSSRTAARNRPGTLRNFSQASGHFVSCVFFPPWLSSACWPCGGMVDTTDSKSVALTGVPVQVRPRLPTKNATCPAAWSRFSFFTRTVLIRLWRDTQPEPDRPGAKPGWFSQILAPRRRHKVDGATSTWPKPAK